MTGVAVGLCDLSRTVLEPLANTTLSLWSLRLARVATLTDSLTDDYEALEGAYTFNYSNPHP